MSLYPRNAAVALETFEHRYPIAGETVHVLIQAYGGLDEFLRELEERGHAPLVKGWMTARKVATMKLDQVRELIPREKIEAIAHETQRDPLSVELQCAQYLPRFFRSFAEDTGGLDFLSGIQRQNNASH